jgi:hypothetical protein
MTAYGMGKSRNFEVLPLLGKNMHFDVPEESAILNYLHGDIARREMEAAVYWEYCRLNSEAVRVASLYRRAVNSGSDDPMLQTMIEANSYQFMNSQWGAIWSSPSFPAAPWIDLRAEEKNEILPFLTTPAADRPLPTKDVRLLDAMKVFDEWKNRAEEARKAYTGERIPARCRAGDGEHIVFTVNFQDGLDRTERQFARWLREPEQSKLFAKYQKRRVGRDKGRKKLIDMFRTLAIRRLHECAKGHVAAVANWLIVNQREGEKYPEQRKSGYTERDIRKAVKRSHLYETELFSNTGLEL